MKPIHLVLSKPFERVEPCASRFWGNPDLPAGYDYPCYTDDEGDPYPYFFVCQINLEEIAAYDTDNVFPHKGLLSFFAKIDHYLGYMAQTDCIGGGVSAADAVKVLYFPCTEDFEEVVLLDDDDKQTSPSEMEVHFDFELKEKYGDDHCLLSPPNHREWENWEHPFEDWEVLLQVDSFTGSDFNLNFLDCGVLDFLISPAALRAGDFSDVRAIVLST